MNKIAIIILGITLTTEKLLLTTTPTKRALIVAPQRSYWQSMKKGIAVLAVTTSAYGLTASGSFLAQAMIDKDTKRIAAGFILCHITGAAAFGSALLLALATNKDNHPHND
jgi:hypothetical protein